MFALPPTLAAVHFSDGEAADIVLDRTVTRLINEGWKIDGYRQVRPANSEGCSCAMYLQNIATGQMTLISQTLGSGAKGCKLNPQQLALATETLRTQLDHSTDLLVLNRFGKDESEGQGLRSVIERAFELEIPVLTAVRNEYLHSWQEFSGDCGVKIGLDSGEILDWCYAALNPNNPILAYRP
jgi:hypothetical protein